VPGRRLEGAQRREGRKASHRCCSLDEFTSSHA
jgi:hypothetical protein